MSKGFEDFECILVTTCEITNFVLVIPIKVRKVQAITEALIHRDMCIFGLPKLLIVNKDSALMEGIQFILLTINC